MSDLTFPRLLAQAISSLSVATLQGVALLAIFYISITSFYNLYLHPLSRFPGPKLAAISRLPYLRAQLGGRLPQWMHGLHTFYSSDVVRMAPDALSFTNASAWKEMYAHHQGRPNFGKDFIIYGRAGNDAASVLTAGDADHSRMRRLLAHAFSEKALKSQEQLLLDHVAKLIRGLHGEIDSAANGHVDMVKWLKWVTFDIIGDLSFGIKFDSLTNQEYHPWASIIQDHVKSVVFLSAVRRYPILDKMAQILMPPSVRKKRASHLASISDKVDERLNSTTERPDFMTYIQRHNDEKGMSLREIKANMSVFIGAGSETVATTLCGAVYYLGKNPHALVKAQNEVRDAFRASEGINMASTLDLPYLSAVLAESGRVYPGALAGQPHIAPSGGASVCGQWIPEGTRVQMSQWAVYQSTANFSQPHRFIPERWLGDEGFSKDQKEAYQPFSVGPRNCIGKNLAQAELRLILANFLWAFDFQICESTDRDWSDQDVYLRWQKKPLIVKLAKSGVHLRAE
ncbi:hypothetical protein ACLMJK_006553 [Lecanora helva]